MPRRMILKIHGDVQGVGFRYYVKKFSQDNNIFGLAKNESDGTVSIVAEGEDIDLHHLMDFCYNGIRHALVRAVDVTWERSQNDFSDFEIK